MLKNLPKMQLQIQYRPVELRPYMKLSEEPAKSHAQEAAGRYQEGGNLTKYQQEGCNGPFLGPMMY